MTTGKKEEAKKWMEILRNKDDNKLFHPRDVFSDEYYEQSYLFDGTNIHMIRVHEGSQILHYVHCGSVAKKMGYSDGKHLSHFQSSLLVSPYRDKWFTTDEDSRAGHKIDRHHVRKNGGVFDGEVFVSRDFFIKFLFDVCSKQGFNDRMKKDFKAFLNSLETKILEDFRNKKALTQPEDGSDFFDQSPLMESTKTEVSSETTDLKDIKVSSPVAPPSQIILSNENYSFFKKFQRTNYPELTIEEAVNRFLKLKSAEWKSAYDMQIAVARHLKETQEKDSEIS